MPHDHRHHGSHRARTSLPEDPAGAAPASSPVERARAEDAGTRVGPPASTEVVRQIVYVPASRRSPVHGIVGDLLGTVLRMAVLAVVVVLLLVGTFVGGLALLGKAIELIPDSSSATTPATTIATSTP
jgi:hypothetical protein